MTESCIDSEPDRPLRVVGAADDLVEVHEAHERQAAAADLGRVAQRPQPAPLRLGLELAHQLVGLVGPGLSGPWS